MNIKEFKKGDIIVRTKPAKSLGPITSLMGEVIERCGDRSYMGEKLEYIGMANGQIYLRWSEDSESMFRNRDVPLDLAIDLWDEGWEIWIDPLTLTGNEVPKVEPRTEAELIAKIDMAISTEDYEEADVLKKELDALTNNK